MRTAKNFAIGQRVKIKGALKSGCNDARIVENRGDCASDQPPCQHGYYIRFANGMQGGGWYDHDFVDPSPKK